MVVLPPCKFHLYRTVMIKFIDSDDAERFSITHDTDLFSLFPDRDFSKRN